MQTTSIWEEESFYAAQDVIIAGAGLVGLWTAFELKSRKPKLKVTIVERGIIPTGASTRNAGFACFGSPTELLHNATILGEEDMWRIVDMRYKGIKKIRKTFSDKQIDFDNCGGYECYNNMDVIENITSRLTWLNKGLKNITGEKNSLAFANRKLKKFGLCGF